MVHAAPEHVVLMTPDEFLSYPLPEGKAELVRGVVRVTPPTDGPHGRVGTNIVLRLAAWAEPRDAGWVFADGAGYLLAALPRTVRAPDASFIAADRYPAAGLSRGFLPMPPDLAIEVRSPDESDAELAEKREDYQACGTPLFWIIDPMRRTVSIWELGRTVRVLRDGDIIDGGTVLPGFTCEVTALFRGLAWRDGVK